MRATIGATGAVSMSCIWLIIAAGAASANCRAAPIVSALRPAMLADCQNDLANSLKDFQDLYGRADHVPASTLKEAIGGIARQATATAILALGLSQRVRLAARQN